MIIQYANILIAKRKYSNRVDSSDVLIISLLGLEDGQDEVDDCLESEHDEEDEVDEKRRKVSKVNFLEHFYIFRH